MLISRTCLRVLVLLLIAAVYSRAQTPETTRDVNPRCNNNELTQICGDKLTDPVVETVCIQGAILDTDTSECRCKRLTHYLEISGGLSYCRVCKDPARNDSTKPPCTFCSFNQIGNAFTCYDEPVTYISSDDQVPEERFEVGPGCMAYINQQILFVIPTKTGWVEIGQNMNMEKPPVVRLMNKRPSTVEEAAEAKRDIDYVPKTDQTQAILDVQFFEIDAGNNGIPQDPDYFYKIFEFRDYSDIEYKSCVQAFYDTLFISGIETQDPAQSKLFSFKISQSSDIIQNGFNKNQDKNMFAHYHFRTKKEIAQEFPLTRIDMMIFLSTPQVLAIGSNDSNELVLLPGHYEESDEEDLKVSKKIDLLHSPTQVIGFENQKLLVLYTDTTESPVTRDVFTVNYNRTFTSKTIESLYDSVTQDLSADFLQASKTPQKMNLLAIFSVNQTSQSTWFYTVEVLDTAKYKSVGNFEVPQTFKSKTGDQENLWNSPFPTNKGFVRLLPFSNFVLLAVEGQGKILLKSFLQSSSEQRVLKTSLIAIQDLQVGLHEKFVHIQDSNSASIHQYHIPEIKCPSNPEITSCNNFFMNRDVLCGENSGKIFVHGKCVCRPGYFLNQTHACEKCRCSQPYQICGDSATDCGDAPVFRHNFDSNQQIVQACHTTSKLVIQEKNAVFSVHSINFFSGQIQITDRITLAKDSLYSQDDLRISCSENSSIITGKFGLTKRHDFFQNYGYDGYNQIVSANSFQRKFDGRLNYDIVESNFKMFPLNFLIASSLFKEEESPIYEVYGITEEVTNIEAQQMYANYNLKFEVSNPTSAIACASIFEGFITSLMAAVSPFWVSSDSKIEIFLIEYQIEWEGIFSFDYYIPGPVSKLSSHSMMANEHYFKMKIFQKLNFSKIIYLLSVTKSKKILIDKIKYQDEEYAVVSEESIQKLPKEQDLVGVEMMHDIYYFVACTQRACAVVNHSKKGDERLIFLGESVSSIFRVHNKAFFGVIDSSQNSIGYYYLSEVVFTDDPMIQEKNGIQMNNISRMQSSQNYLEPSNFVNSDEAKSCKAGFQLLEFKFPAELAIVRISGIKKTVGICFCLNDQYFYRSSGVERSEQIYCLPCHKDCQFCDGPLKDDCSEYPWGGSYGKYESSFHRGYFLRQEPLPEEENPDFQGFKNFVIEKCPESCRSCKEVEDGEIICLECDSLHQKLSKDGKRCIDCTKIYDKENGINRAHPECYIPPETFQDGFYAIFELSVEDYLPKNNTDVDRGFGHTQKVLDITLENTTPKFEDYKDYRPVQLDYFSTLNFVSDLLGGIAFRGEVFSLLFKFYLVPKLISDSSIESRTYLVVSNQQIVKKVDLDDKDLSEKLFIRFTLSEFQTIDPDRYSHIGIEYEEDSSLPTLFAEIWSEGIPKYVVLKAEKLIPIKKDNVISYATQTEVVVKQIPQDPPTPIQTAGLATFAVIIKYFQIVDLLINFFGKINVSIGEELEKAVRILKSAEFPKISFLESIDFTKDGGQEQAKNYQKDKEEALIDSSKLQLVQKLENNSESSTKILQDKNSDFRVLSNGPEKQNPYSTYIYDTLDKERPAEQFLKFTKMARNTRTKLIKTNFDLFIISGQNGFIATLFVFSYLIVLLLDMGASKRMIINGLVFLQRQILILFFVNFQFISFTQLSLHDIRREEQGTYIYSFILSLTVNSVVTLELIRGYIVLKKYKEDSEAVKLINYEKGLLHTFWCKDLHEKQKIKGNVFMVMDRIRWSCFQFVVVTLQMNYMFQITLILAIDMLYLWWIYPDLKQRKTFKNSGVWIKYLAQEFTIALFLIILTLFASLEKTDFSTSRVHYVLQIIIIVVVFAAIFCQFISVAFNLIFVARNFFKQRKLKAEKEKTNKISKLEEKAREEIPDEPVSKITRKAVSEEDQPQPLEIVEIRAQIFDKAEQKARAELDYEPVSKSTTKNKTILMKPSRLEENIPNRPNQVENPERTQFFSRLNR